MKTGLIWFAFALTSVIQAGVPLNDRPVEEEIADPKPLGDFEEVVVPLIRVQNLFLVEATIDSVSGYFVLDTGAPGLVLNKNYFDGSKMAEATASYGVTGGGQPVYRYTADSLAIKSLHYKYVRADLVNLGHLENARGVKILGLLGTNLFTELEMELDLRRNVMKLHRTDKKGNVLHPGRLMEQQERKEDLSLPFDIVHDLMFVKGNVGKKTLRFCVDTGAEVGVLSNRVGNKVLDHFQLRSQTTLKGSADKSMKVLNGNLMLLEFEGADFKGMPFVLTNLQSLEAAYGTVLNGLLGYDFLYRGVTVINFRKKTINMYFYN